MFTEQINKTGQNGWIEVITGSMFSGKTEELLRRIKRARIANLSVGIFKPDIDTRFSPEAIVSHDSNSLQSIAVSKAVQIEELAKDFDVVGIDEAQFFEHDLCKVCDKLANTGKRVIVAGLDMDFKSEPFTPIPELMARAEFVTKLHAVCVKCGNLANYSHRTTKSKEKVVLGEKDIYEALCRTCFNNTGAER